MVQARGRGVLALPANAARFDAAGEVRCPERRCARAARHTRPPEPSSEMEEAMNHTRRLVVAGLALVVFAVPGAAALGAGLGHGTNTTTLPQQVRDATRRY